ncbi:hypothetical protein [Silvimonas sp.]|uniref:hypothetical protein n=1 Tax=Silvimonas sp. TaxID=2650811 RepID=UPI00283D5EF4|nr:hypothetical protein [Silvimonas sp.]MDR3427918.1 hypothetical protein [Silvimonas sp.]
MEVDIGTEVELSKVEFDGYENTSVQLPCDICGAETEHKIVKAVGFALVESTGYCAQERYHQICQCSQCAAIVFRTAEGNDEIFEEYAPGENRPAPYAEELWPPRVLKSELIPNLGKLPPYVAALYRNAAVQLRTGNITMAVLTLNTVLELVWKHTRTPGLALGDCVNDWVAKQWLTEQEGSQVKQLMEHQAELAQGKTVPNQLKASAAFDLVELLLQRVYLGVENPSSSVDLAIEKALEERGLSTGS